MDVVVNLLKFRILGHLWIWVGYLVHSLWQQWFHLLDSWFMKEKLTFVWQLSFVAIEVVTLLLNVKWISETISGRFLKRHKHYSIQELNLILVKNRQLLFEGWLLHQFWKMWRGVVCDLRMGVSRHSPTLLLVVTFRCKIVLLLNLCHVCIKQTIIK